MEPFWRRQTPQIVLTVGMIYALYCLLSLGDIPTLQARENHPFIIVPVFRILIWPCMKRDHAYFTVGQRGAELVCIRHSRY